METMIYDVIILGAGPAGLAAGLYAGRSCLSTLIIEKGQDGGQIAQTDEIENYPGQLVEGESGTSLVARMAEQAAKFGAVRARDTIRTISLEGDIKVLKSRRKEYRGKTLILATGASPRPIGCQNEKLYVGSGISYCATCDGMFYQGKEVYVVGGGDAAVEEAIFLTKFARKVTIIHRRDQLRAAKSIQEKAFRNEKIHFLWDSVLEEVSGQGVVQKLTVRNVKTDEVSTIEADPADGILGVFGFIGMEPNTKLYEELLPLEKGYIRTDEDMHTAIPGIYAAGDLRVKSLRQVITAAADGAIAAMQAEKYLAEME